MPRRGVPGRRPRNVKERSTFREAEGVEPRNSLPIPRKVWTKNSLGIPTGSWTLLNQGLDQLKCKRTLKSARKKSARKKGYFVPEIFLPINILPITGPPGTRLPHASRGGHPPSIRPVFYTPQDGMARALGVLSEFVSNLWPDD
eukprot:2885386-Pyramimonas_sp.AAC.8